MKSYVEDLILLVFLYNISCPIIVFLFTLFEDVSLFYWQIYEPISDLRLLIGQQKGVWPVESPIETVTRCLFYFVLDLIEPEVTLA